MDVNGVVNRAGSFSQGSPVVRDPAPVSRAASDHQRAAHLARDVAEPAIEEQVSPATDALAERTEARTRGGMRLRLDKATEQVVAQIVNANNEVIKQIPPEEALRIAARYREVTGLIFDTEI